MSLTYRDIHQEKVLILDFGSQYTQLIARRLRESGVYCEILPYDLSYERAKEFRPKGIVLSGGPESVNANATLVAPNYVFEFDIPVLGICYGMQAMAKQLGGRLKPPVKVNLVMPGLSCCTRTNYLESYRMG